MPVTHQSVPVYRNTQPGTLLRAILLFVLIALLALGSTDNAWIVSAAVFVIITLACFHSLTTEVYEESIVIWFGVGFIRRTIAMSQVKECSVTRTPWYVGWGLRLLPGGGWIWNVSGLQSVEISYVNDGRFRIGTNHPEELAAAIAEVNKRSKQC